jgi:hypothetical protein
MNSAITEISTLVAEKSFKDLQLLFKTQPEYKNLRLRELATKSCKSLYLLTTYQDPIFPETWTPLELQANGIILEKDTGTIVARCQSRFKTLSTDDSAVSQLGSFQKLMEIHQDFTAEYLEDGTVIRLYNYLDSWYTATSKCIDARFSYWNAGRSFDDLFFEVFAEKDLELLDPTCTYCFVLKHVDNRIVIQHLENQVVFSCKINNLSGKISFTKPEELVNTSVTLPLVISSSSSDLRFPLENHFNPGYRGIFFRFSSDTTDPDYYTYDFAMYGEIKSVRGNVPGIRGRCLELILEKDYESLQKLNTFYPTAGFCSQFVNQSGD